MRTIVTILAVLGLGVLSAQATNLVSNGSFALPTPTPSVGVGDVVNPTDWEPNTLVFPYSSSANVLDPAAGTGRRWAPRASYGGGYIFFKDFVIASIEGNDFNNGNGYQQNLGPITNGVTYTFTADIYGHDMFPSIYQLSLVSVTDADTPPDVTGVAETTGEVSVVTNLVGGCFASNVTTVVTNTIGVSFDSELGATYVLQSSPDLVSSEFMSISPSGSGTGGNLTLFDTLPLPVSKNYRVELSPVNLLASVSELDFPVPLDSPGSDGDPPVQATMSYTATAADDGRDLWLVLGRRDDGGAGNLRNCGILRTGIDNVVVTAQ
jgi:hypothetical protein